MTPQIAFFAPFLCCLVRFLCILCSSNVGWCKSYCRCDFSGYIPGAVRPFSKEAAPGCCCVRGCLLFRSCSSFPEGLPWPGRCELSVSLSVTWLETWFHSPKFPCKNQPIPLISSFILVYFIFFFITVLLFSFSPAFFDIPLW